MARFTRTALRGASGFDDGMWTIWDGIEQTSRAALSRKAENCICIQNQKRSIAAESGLDEFDAGESAAGEPEERPNMTGAEAPPSKDAAEYVKASNFTKDTLPRFWKPRIEFVWSAVFVEVFWGEGEDRGCFNA